MIADEVFKAPRSADNVRGAIQIQAKMAEMTGPPDVSAKQAPIHDQRTTDTGPESEHRHVRTSAGRADPRLRQEGSVRVVGDGHNGVAPQMFRPVESFESAQPARHKRNRP